MMVTILGVVILVLLAVAFFGFLVMSGCAGGTSLLRSCLEVAVVTVCVLVFTGLIGLGCWLIHVGAWASAQP